MFTRTERLTQTPEAEDMDLEEAMCPPHVFDQGWGLAPQDDLHADTVPVLFCAACGDIRLMRVPSDAP